MASYWVPALRTTNGHFPAPLDDVYIYFQIARSTSEGCLLCFGEEAGATTGATSPTYALALSVLALFARSPLAMGWAVAALTLLLLIDTSQSLARLVRARSWEGAVLATIAPLLPFSLPILNWSLVSGMESAWVAAVLARVLTAVDRAQRASPSRRARAQWIAGLWIGVLAVSRPELAPMAFAFVVSTMHASGSAPVARSLLRTALPSAALLAAHGLFATFAAGSSIPAGALRKVVLYDPTASGLQRGVVFLTNALRLFVEGFEIAWGSVSLALVVAVGAHSFLGTRSRRLVVPLLFGGLASFVLVCFNRTAPFQNLRYLVPTFVALLFVAVIGLGNVARVRSRAWRALAFGAAGIAAVLAMRSHGRQASHYAASARNIHEQQVTVGLALRNDPEATRIFVGDAGAIPYFSEKPALDGLGLGGWKKLPFASASVVGEGAVVELIERLPPIERPDTLAVYTSWWPELTSSFGARVSSVRIEDNVICADAEKTIFRADWSTLREVELAGELDVGDLVSEREHALMFHGETQPRVGLVVAQDEDGARRFDGTRSLKVGDAITFDLVSESEHAGAFGLRWTVAPESSATLRITGPGVEREQELPPTAPGRWTTLITPGVASRSATIRLEVVRGHVELARVALVED